MDEDSISQKLMVRQRYLRLRFDIPISDPLPTGFIQKQEDGGECWVQFKYEWLANFCYKCSMIDHVTGRCNFQEHAGVTVANVVTARLYGPWLRSKD